MTLKRRKIKLPKKAIMKKQDVRPKTWVVTEQDLAEALRNSCGLQSTAGKLLGISQPAVSQRIKNSTYLQKVVSEVKEEFLDICESELRKHIYRGNLVACIFYLKTQGKARGYTERQELDVNANITGGVLVVPAPMTTEEWIEKGERIAEEKKQKLLTRGDENEESNR